MKWYDNKPVHLISTYCGIEPKDKCLRWSVALKGKQEIDRPRIVKEYNRYMGGVDFCDMMMELYRTNIRNNEWYMRIVYYCIDLAVLNAWMLYRRHMQQRNESKKSVSLKKFRCNIASSLIRANKSCARKRGRPSNASDSDAPCLEQKSVHLQLLYHLLMCGMINLLIGLFILIKE